MRREAVDLTLGADRGLGRRRRRVVEEETSGVPPEPLSLRDVAYVGEIDRGAGQGTSRILEKVALAADAP